MMVMPPWLNTLQHMLPHTFGQQSTVTHVIAFPLLLGLQCSPRLCNLVSSCFSTGVRHTQSLLFHCDTQIPGLRVTHLGFWLLSTLESKLSSLTCQVLHATALTSSLQVAELQALVQLVT